jgi:hypothetical protein
VLSAPRQRRAAVGDSEHAGGTPPV